MVKKKPPFVLITISVLALGGVAFMNSRSHPVDPKDADQQAPPASTEAVGKARGNVDSKELGSAMKNSMSTAAPIKPTLAGQAKPGTGAPGPGSIVTQKQDKYQPKPNDTMTSAQWYRGQ